MTSPTGRTPDVVPDIVERLRGGWFSPAEAQPMLDEAAAEIERLRREIEIRKAAAKRFQLCPDHNGKLPIDGECVMCFTERNTRNRIRHEQRALSPATPEGKGK